MSCRPSIRRPSARRAARRVLLVLLACVALLPGHAWAASRAGCGTASSPSEAPPDCCCAGPMGAMMPVSPAGAMPCAAARVPAPETAGHCAPADISLSGCPGCTDETPPPAPTAPASQDAGAAAGVQLALQLLAAPAGVTPLAAALAERLAAGLSQPFASAGDDPAHGALDARSLRERLCVFRI